MDRAKVRGSAARCGASLAGGKSNRLTGRKSGVALRSSLMLKSTAEDAF
jgi:hypothetical protein